MFNNTYSIIRKDPTTSIHRLLCRLPGSLILFAPYTLVPQRQYMLDNCLRLRHSSKLYSDITPTV